MEIIDPRTLKPLDEEKLVELAKKHDKWLTVEDGVIAGGMGSAILELVSAQGLGVQIERLGFPDRFVEGGAVSKLLARYGLDEKGIATAAKAWWGK